MFKTHTHLLLGIYWTQSLFAAHPEAKKVRGGAGGGEGEGREGGGGGKGGGREQQGEKGRGGNMAEMNID